MLKDLTFDSTYTMKQNYFFENIDTLSRIVDKNYLVFCKVVTVNQFTIPFGECCLFK